MLTDILKIFLVLLASAFVSKVAFLSLDQQLPIAILSTEGLLSLLWGLRLDAASAALTSLPIVFILFFARIFKYQSKTILKTFLVIGVLCLINATGVDAIYTQDASKHITYEIFTTGGSGLELIGTAFSSYRSYLLLSVLLCICVYAVIYRLDFFLKFSNTSNRTHLSIYLLVYLFVTVTIIRGGWSDAPQSPMSAYKIGDPDKAYLAWSAPYSLSYYFVQGKKKAIKNITKKPSENFIVTWKQLDSQKEQASLDNLKSANVVFVLLESWGATDSQAFSGGVNATPFFDNLRSKSFSTTALYANGYRTVQGLFASHCSFPNPNNGIIAGTHLQNFSYSCLPSILRERGWQTHFIQGSGKGIVGAFAQSIGFEYSYGKKDFNFEAPMNDWGYMDEGIYRFSLNLITDLQNKPNQKPFFVTINTGTTHSEFLSEGDNYAFGNDTVEHSRQSVIHHADSALQAFIEELNTKLTQPTLVVLMSDHTTRSSKEGIAKYSIPFLMYATDGSIPAQILNISAGQSDIGASILDWLNGYAPWFSGHSLFKENYRSTTNFVRENIFYWINHDRLIQIDLSNNSIKDCFIIQKNTYTIEKTNCLREVFQTQYQDALHFNGLTQHLLFSGESKNYRSMDALFGDKQL